MITGGSTANLAIILVDARTGVITQTRRHTFLVSLCWVSSMWCWLSTKWTWWTSRKNDLMRSLRNIRSLWLRWVFLM